MSYVLIPGVVMVALATTAQLLPGAVLIQTETVPVIGAAGILFWLKRRRR